MILSKSTLENLNRIANDRIGSIRSNRPLEKFIERTYGYKPLTLKFEYVDIKTKKGKKSLIESFEKKQNYEERDNSRNKFARIYHFCLGLLSLPVTLTSIKSLDFASIVYTSFYTQFNFGLDKVFHNIAMRKSQALVRYLHSRGIHDEKYIAEVVDLYLKKRGGIIYSNYVRKFQKDKIYQIAKGEPASQFKGIMTYIRDKYTLFSPQNRAGMVKAKRNLLHPIKNAYTVVKSFNTNMKFLDLN